MNKTLRDCERCGITRVSVARPPESHRHLCATCRRVEQIKRERRARASYRGNSYGDQS
jgi:hypothetical protein